MPSGPVQPTPAPRQRAIFADSEAGRVDVHSTVPPVQVVPDRMMMRMLTSPVLIGRQGDKAAKKSDERVCPPRTEERSVATIVLNDEESHDQPACRKRKSQREQHRNLDRGIHRGYQSEVAYAGR